MSALVYQGCRLTVGILYPAYCSFKAVRSKNVKEYVKWMMYWIVFALFSFAEAFADFILVWFPFYYELKICFILWLVAPATKGSSVLYRKVVHPQLLKREKHHAVSSLEPLPVFKEQGLILGSVNSTGALQLDFYDSGTPGGLILEIDDNISKATDQGYAALITLGSRGFNFATSVVLSTAIKGSSKLSDQLQKSLSLNDLSGDTVDYRPRRRLQTNISLDEEEEDNRLIRERFRLETAVTEESLDNIDREVDEAAVLESATDVQRRRRRRKIESTIHEVMSDSSPTLAQSLVGSVRLPRKYKPVAKEVSAAAPEDLDRSEDSRSTPVASPEQNVSSPFPSSTGTAPASISHYFRSPDPASPSTVPSGHHGPSSPSAPSGSSGLQDSSGPVTSTEPSSSVGSTTSSADPPPDPAASGLSAASISRRLRLSFFSSSK